jgi:hypothetical protein
MMITEFVLNMLGSHGARGAADQEPPFVLVAHDVEGKWDVYAKRFDTPLASFDQREPACHYASGLAKARRDCLVLVRENRLQHSATT